MPVLPEHEIDHNRFYCGVISFRKCVPGSQLSTTYDDVWTGGCAAYAFVTSALDGGECSAALPRE
jgi:hypothetical protein